MFRSLAEIGSRIHGNHLDPPIPHLPSPSSADSTLRGNHLTRLWGLTFASAGPGSYIEKNMQGARVQSPEISKLFSNLKLYQADVGNLGIIRKDLICKIYLLLNSYSKWRVLALDAKYAWNPIYFN